MLQISDKLLEISARQGDQVKNRGTILHFFTSAKFREGYATLMSEF